MTRMHNPPHPGETLREDILPALGLSVTETAAQLGVSRAAISPGMALRLEGLAGGDEWRERRFMGCATSRP